MRRSGLIDMKGMLWQKERKFFTLRGILGMGPSTIQWTAVYPRRPVSHGFYHDPVACSPTEGDVVGCRTYKTSNFFRKNAQQKGSSSSSSTVTTRSKKGKVIYRMQRASKSELLDFQKVDGATKGTVKNGDVKGTIECELSNATQEHKLPHFTDTSAKHFEPLATKTIGPNVVDETQKHVADILSLPQFTDTSIPNSIIFHKTQLKVMKKCRSVEVRKVRRQSNNLLNRVCSSGHKKQKIKIQLPENKSIPDLLNCNLYSFWSVDNSVGKPSTNISGTFIELSPKRIRFTSQEMVYSNARKPGNGRSKKECAGIQEKLVHGVSIHAKGHKLSSNEPLKAVETEIKDLSGSDLKADTKQVLDVPLKASNYIRVQIKDTGPQAAGTGKVMKNLKTEIPIGNVFAGIPVDGCLSSVKHDIKLKSNTYFSKNKNVDSGTSEVSKEPQKSVSMVDGNPRTKKEPEIRSFCKNENLTIHKHFVQRTKKVSKVAYDTHVIEKDGKIITKLTIKKGKRSSPSTPHKSPVRTRTFGNGKCQIADLEKVTGETKMNIVLRKPPEYIRDSIQSPEMLGESQFSRSAKATNLQNSISGHEPDSSETVMAKEENNTAGPVRETRSLKVSSSNFDRIVSSMKLELSNSAKQSDSLKEEVGDTYKPPMVKNSAKPELKNEAIDAIASALSGKHNAMTVNTGADAVVRVEPKEYQFHSSKNMLLKSELGMKNGVQAQRPPNSLDRQNSSSTAPKPSFSVKVNCKPMFNSTNSLEDLNNIKFKLNHPDVENVAWERRRIKKVFSNSESKNNGFVRNDLPPDHKLDSISHPSDDKLKVVEKNSIMSSAPRFVQSDGNCTVQNSELDATHFSGDSSKTKYSIITSLLRSRQQFSELAQPPNKLSSNAMVLEGNTCGSSQYGANTVSGGLKLRFPPIDCGANVSWAPSCKPGFPAPSSVCSPSQSGASEVNGGSMPVFPPSSSGENATCIPSCKPIFPPPCNKCSSSQSGENEGVGGLSKPVFQSQCCPSPPCCQLPCEVPKSESVNLGHPSCCPPPPPCYPPSPCCPPPPECPCAPSMKSKTYSIMDVSNMAKPPVPIRIDSIPKEKPCFPPKPPGGPSRTEAVPGIQSPSSTNPCGQTKLAGSKLTSASWFEATKTFLSFRALCLKCLLAEMISNIVSFLSASFSRSKKAEAFSTCNVVQSSMIDSNHPLIQATEKSQRAPTEKGTPKPKPLAQKKIRYIKTVKSSVHNDQSRRAILLEEQRRKAIGLKANPALAYSEVLNIVFNQKNEFAPTSNPLGRRSAMN